MSLKSLAHSPRPHTVNQQTLADLNLDEELLANYLEARSYLNSVLQSDEIPPNQVAQCFNTLTAILKEMTKTRTELHTAERLKRLEDAMVSAAQLLPPAAQDAFFRAYEDILK